MMYVWLLVGFALLIKGADFFVDGASSIARILKVPAVIIGLTIVAMGTSAPEAAVSISAGLSGKNEIAISNVVGSNIFNLLVVAGVCAAIKPFPVEKSIFKRDFPINMAFSFLLMYMVWQFNQVSRVCGIILLILMATYLFITVRAAIKDKTDGTEEDTSSDIYKFFSDKFGKVFHSKNVSEAILSIIFCGVGLTAIIFGGDMVVDNASAIAKTFGLSDTLIGLTIVAIGTSLPELVTSIVAAGKGQSDMAMGNVVGSNIFNLAFILGLSSTIHPIAAVPEALFDLVIMTATTLVMYILCLGKKHILNRYEGVLCVLIYIGYSAYIILR